jgi:MFS family permease
MTTLTSTPGAIRILGSSVIARLPLAMLGIALLIHAKHLTGSFAAAGLVAGAYAVATGVGGPLLGRVVDRRGQTAVLVPSVLTTAALLATAAALPAGAPLALVVALSAAIGLACPPLGACVRTLLPDLVDEDTVRVAYAVDSTAVELTWVFGPPLAFTVGAVWSTAAALAAAGAVLLLGTLVFAAQPASRRWRPAATAERGQGGSLRAPGMRTLVSVLTATGMLFGAVDVAVPATAEALAGPLLGVWGLGSLAGGAIATRRGGGAHTPAGLALMLAFLAAAHLALAAVTASVVALAVVLFVAGSAIAPTFAGVYAMVDRVAPAGTVTEAFAWLATAGAVGSAAGAAVAGNVVEQAGPAAAFVLAGIAGAVALVTILLRGATLQASVATASAAAPSPRPTKPIPSPVVAFTLTEPRTASSDA